MEHTTSLSHDLTSSNLENLVLYHEIPSHLDSCLMLLFKFDTWILSHNVTMYLYKENMSHNVFTSNKTPEYHNVINYDRHPGFI